ncbi:GGDEF domain-containing protein [Andreprevotia chitinilytica]|uniref:GGDEF domain-containing protein n=1 Tax=Andreprevotia chitinilytica TaxID=396808 RepID=UPI0005548B16|nr:diguanylate cyclase [Andreprevotia chitinilytica]
MSVEILSALLDRQELTSARECALIEVRTARAMGDQIGAAQAQLVAAIALGRQGQIAESVQELERLMPRLRRLQQNQLLMKALDELAGHHLLLGHVNQAMRRWLDCLEAAVQAGDDAMFVMAHLGIGKIYFGLGDFEQALAHHLRSLEHADAVEAPASLGSIYLCIANDYLQLGRHDEALVSLRLARRKLASHGHTQLEAESWLYEAMALIRQGELDVGQAALTEARQLIRETRHHWCEFHTAFTQAELDRAMSLPQSCQIQLELARRLAHDLQSATLIEQAERALYLHHKAHGQFEAALISHRAYHSAMERNLIRQQETRLLGATLKRVRRLETRLKLLQSDQENQTLQARLRHHQAVLSTLSREVETDALTGTANRRALETQLDFLAEHEPSALSILMLDIDHFKAINDNYGHAAGDQVLAQIGQLLRESCRNGETVTRYGGEEFCIVLPGLDGSTATLVAERLRRRVASETWADIAVGLKVTTSIGCASARPGEGPRGVIARADALLYRAKKQGRNRVCDEASGDLLLG